MIIERNQIQNLLDGLAQHFESEAQAHDQFAEYSGWGQFLDAAKHHKQIGLYGTAAGLIVLSVAGRGTNPLTRQAAGLIEHWWKNCDTEQPQYFLPRVVQTPRLAFINLALRLAATTTGNSVQADTEKALLDRILASGLWGDYWFSDSSQDQTPRPFCSAISVLSFALLRQDLAPLNSRLLGVADILEERLATTNGLPLFHAAAIGAAVLSVKKDSLDPRALSNLADIALAGPRGLGERAVYFYDYEYVGNDNKPTFGRDYFFAPLDVLIALAGFQAGAPAGMRLLAETILGKLIDNIAENGGAYRPGAGERLSSVDQAWAALLLKVSIPQSTLPSWRSRARYGLYRHRKGNWFTNTAVPVFSLFFTTACTVLLKDTGWLASSIAAIALLIIGGLYGKDVFRKVVGLIR